MVMAWVFLSAFLLIWWLEGIRPVGLAKGLFLVVLALAWVLIPIQVGRYWCSGKVRRLGVILGASILVLYWAETRHNFSGKVDRLFHAAEVTRVYPGAPQCHVLVSLPTKEDRGRFLETLQHFAQSHDLHEFVSTRHLFPRHSGLRPTYQNKHVLLWRFVTGDYQGGNRTGHVRLGPHDPSYPKAEFKRLADSLAGALQEVFTNGVEVTFANLEE